MLAPKPVGKITSRLALGLCLGIAGILSCATQPAAEVSTPGFLFGLAHGCIMPFSLVASFFTNVRMYAFPNAGIWYDVGYFLGAAILLGGGGAKARR